LGAACRPWEQPGHRTDDRTHDRPDVGGAPACTVEATLDATLDAMDQT
jgi:hypothetical protein